MHFLLGWFLNCATTRISAFFSSLYVVHIRCSPLLIFLLYQKDRPLQECKRSRWGRARDVKECTKDSDWISLHSQIKMETLLLQRCTWSTCMHLSSVGCRLAQMQQQQQNVKRKLKCIWTLLQNVRQCISDYPSPTTQLLWFLFYSLLYQPRLLLILRTLLLFANSINC